MKTQRTYYENTYLKDQITAITAMGSDEKGPYLRLRDTIFHPQGGGQPSDEGFIDRFNVSKVTLAPDNKEEINHYIRDLDETIKVGDEVKISINIEKRLEFAALHTAGHLLANVLRKLKLLDASNIHSVRSHHFPREAYFQIKPSHFDVSSAQLMEAIMNEINLLIKAKLEVSTLFENNLRYMQIAGFDRDPCGGTHLANIFEIGNFSIRNIRINKEGLRVGYDAAYRGEEALE